MEIIYAIIGFILAVGILAIIHELGHFYAARLFKVRVLRFSIGFGRSYRIWYDKLGTEYVISAIPFGGYIQLLDEMEAKELITSSDQHMTINSKPPWVRIIIFLAGPLCNMLFAVIVYCLVFIIGISTPRAIIGTVQKGTVADAAGLKSGLEITQVGDNKVYDWENVSINLIKNLTKDYNFVKLKVYDQDLATTSIHILNLNNRNMEYSHKGDILGALGLEPFSISEPKIWKVLPNFPAFKVGIKPGDIIVAIDNVPIVNSNEVSKYLYNKIGKQVNIDVARNEEIISFTIVPVSKKLNNGEERGVIGVSYRAKPYPPELIRKNRYGLATAFYLAIQKTYNYTVLTGYSLYSMTIGKLYLKDLSGPVAIGYYAGQSIKKGIEYFLNFLGLLSISLGILNLLPIPVLDGGSIIYCMYEIIVGKPASAKAIMLGRSIGLFFLISLLAIVFINDIIQLF